jgi:hypothetical protein
VNRVEICGACGHANPPDWRFCGGCGARTVGEISCGACGASNPADQRSCNQCGGTLAAASAEAARIDRLPERFKAVLQSAAVIGKEFSEPVLARVAELEASELEPILRDLVEGEFLYEQDLDPEVVYAFKRPVTMEVAYGSQLADRRAASHAKVATAIAEQGRGRLDELAPLIAAHWEAAGETLEAARWHARAGARTGVHQPAQSLQHWRRVRELVDTLPESKETTTFGVTSRIFTLQYEARTRDRRRRRIIAATLFALCLIGAGIGGYLIGNSPKADLDAVRSAAAAEGRTEGSERGADKGYAQGFRAAQKRTYAAAYSAAYKEAYAAEFEDVGLAPPERIPVRGAG